MSNLAEHSYFAPNAFEGIRPLGESITYDEEALGAIAVMIKHELDMDLPAPVSELQLVYRATIAGVGKPKSDGAFYKAGWSNLYVPATELAKPPDVPLSQLASKSKGAIVASPGRTVMEVLIQDPNQPLPLAFAHTLSYPAAQDAGFTVSLGAWKRYAKELDPTREVKRAKIQEEVTRSFMSAIVLQPRNKG